MAQLFVKIPRERIGVLIGPNGRVKEHIEKKLFIKLEIDSETGEITINLKKDAKDPSLLFKAKDTIIAIGRGFSPERAYRLLRDEYTILVIIDLREIFGRSQLNIKRVKGRIIGKEGKTRRIVEEMTEAYVSVYGHTVAILGGIEQAMIAREAISLLIKGSRHATVYNYLQRKKRNLKKQRLELWEGRPLLPEKK